MKSIIDTIVNIYQYEMAVYGISTIPVFLLTLVLLIIFKVAI